MRVAIRCRSCRCYDERLIIYNDTRLTAVFAATASVAFSSPTMPRIDSRAILCSPLLESGEPSILVVALTSTAGAGSEPSWFCHGARSDRNISTGTLINQTAGGPSNLKDLEKNSAVNWSVRTYDAKGLRSDSGKLPNYICIVQTLGLFTNHSSPLLTCKGPRYIYKPLPSLCNVVYGLI
jgi:hypothetical protein